MLATVTALLIALSSIVALDCDVRGVESDECIQVEYEYPNSKQ